SCNWNAWVSSSCPTGAISSMSTIRRRTPIIPTAVAAISATSATAVTASKARTPSSPLSNSATHEKSAGESAGPRNLHWATLYEGERDIVLYADGQEAVVGHVRSAILKKLPYVLMPTGGCGMHFAGHGSWFACDYSFTFFTRTAHVGFFNGGSASSSESA